MAEREIAELERWRVKPAVRFKGEAERHLWRQSEVMLRIAQSREPNRAGRHGNGLIVASLPDGVWFTPWVRDMAWATVALARMGHRDEARAALLAYFNAQPTGKMRAETNGADYQISVVRYFGDGAEEPFFTMEGSTNIEFDDWGEALWVLGEYLRKYDDAALLTTRTYRGRLYESARDLHREAVDREHGEVRRRADRCGRHVDLGRAAEGQEAFRVFDRDGDCGPAELCGSGAACGRRKRRERTLWSMWRLLEKGFAAAFIRDGKLHGTLEEGDEERYRWRAASDHQLRRREGSCGGARRRG